MTDHTARLLDSLQKAHALDAKRIWREAAQLGVSEDLKARLATGFVHAPQTTPGPRNASRGLSDEC